MASEIEFVVEQAGCSSCAALVEEALAPLAEVRAIKVDEEADSAAVRLVSSPELSEIVVDRALAEVSPDADHSYRVKPGSWSIAP